MQYLGCEGTNFVCFVCLKLLCHGIYLVLAIQILHFDARFGVVSSIHTLPMVIYLEFGSCFLCKCSCCSVLFNLFQFNACNQKTQIKLDSIPCNTQSSICNPDFAPYFIIHTLPMVICLEFGSCFLFFSMNCLVQPLPMVIYT
eukprot:577089_1